MNKAILSTVLSLCVFGAGVVLAIDEPAVPQLVNDAGAEASRRIAKETAASIQALGEKPGTKQISAIVFKAIRTSPANVLPIVAAAVRVSPRSAAREIVTAATTAVPNPWKKILYNRLALLDSIKFTLEDEIKPDAGDTRDPKPDPDPGRPDFSIGLSAQQGSGPGAGAPDANGIEMTLAEAIIRTAFDVDPLLSLKELQDAVNLALRMDPETLMREIQNPRPASAAGSNNYANEPLLTPKQPAVSR